MTTPNTLGDKLLEMRYELTALQAKLTDAINTARAEGLLETPTEHEGRRITGYRFIRGTHAGTYVRDPKGTDPLPPGQAPPPPPPTPNIGRPERT